MSDRSSNELDLAAPVDGPSRRGGGRIGRLVRKEVTTILRDRRTIVTLILMPILLYPLLIIAFRHFLIASQLDVEKPDPFRIGMVKNETDLRLVRPHLTSGEQELQDRFSEEELALAKERNYKLIRSDRFSNMVGMLEIETTIAEHLRNGDIDLGIEVLNGDELDASNVRESPQGHVLKVSVAKDHELNLRLVSLEGSRRSQEALHYVERVLALANEISLAEERKNRPRLAAPNVPTATVSVYRAYVEPKESGNVMASLVPLVLILMTITGAVYPAIDLTAGERERGTLEILVAAPIPRMSLLFAKYVSVLTVAVLTALINLASMAVSLEVTGISEKLFPGGLTVTLILQVLGLLLLFAAFFSGVLLAVTSFARTFKEAQVYLIPLMLLSMTPGMLSLVPNIKASGPLLVTPLLNVVLLAREVFRGEATSAAALIVIVSTLFYALTAIAVAARIFGAEAVLYSEQAGWSDFLRRPLHRASTATIPTAMLCVALMFPTHFLITNSLRGAALDLLLVMTPVISVLLFVGFPLAFCRWSRVSPVTGLHLERKASALWLPAFLLGAGLWCFSSELGLLLRNAGVSSIPDELLQKHLEGMQKIYAYGPIVIVFVLGIVPPLTEELFFRGYLFSAFRARTGPATTILTTATIFAVFHLLTKDGLAVERFAPTFLMGIVLGWLAWRSGSVVPGMILHVTYNSSILLLGYYQEKLQARGWALSENDHLPETWLLVATVVSAIGFAASYFLTRASGTRS